VDATRNAGSSTERSRWVVFATALAAAPLLPVALGLAVGIGIDAAVAPPFWLAVGVGVLTAPALVAIRRRHWLFGAGCLFVGALAAGAARHHVAYRRVPANHIVRYTCGEPILTTVTGRLVTEPSAARANYGAFDRWVPRAMRTRCLLAADTLAGKDGPLCVQGLLRATIREPALTLRGGDRVALTGWLYRPHPPDNPGEPDWPVYNRRQSVLAGLSVNDAASVRHLDAGSPRFVTRFRRHCRLLLLDNVTTRDPASVSLLEALILGSRSTVDRTINEAFIATGLVHILSVSGAHLAMLAGAIWFVAALAGRSRRQTAGLVLVAVLAYAALAEPNPPIFRATVMTVLLCVSIWLRRPVRTANWLAASAIVILGVRPTDLFDAGFQLSYVALIGILYLSPAIRDGWRAAVQRLRRVDPADAVLVPAIAQTPQRFRRLRKGAVYLEWAFAVAIAAWLAGLPLALYHFGQSSTWGWLNSVLLAPFISVLMFVGFIKLILTALWPSVGSLLGPVVAAVTWLVDEIVRALASVPGVTFMIPSPPGALVVVAILAMGLWAARRAFRIPGHLVALSMLGCLAGGVFWYTPGRPGDDELHIRVASVGDGLTTIIRLPDGRGLLYDCGASPPYEMYRSTLRPALGYEGIRCLDAVILSHPNLDHYSGLLDLARFVPIREVWATSHLAAHASHAKASGYLVDQLTARGTPIRELHAGDRLLNTGGATLEILWPPPRAERPDLDSNDSSLVIRVTYHGHSVLLTGDIEREPQQWLTEHADVHADVLLLPHHGSVKAWTAGFVHAVAPACVVRSSGESGARASPEFQDLVAGYAYFNTADDGQITIRLTSDGVAIDTHRPRRAVPSSPERAFE
jgi:competence protein ComEC